MNSAQIAIVGLGTAIVLVAIAVLVGIIATVLQWFIDNPILGMLFIAGAAAVVTKALRMW